MDKLKKPFPLHAHQFKPTALTSDKSRGLGLVYVDPRRYQHRLDEAKVRWEDELEIIDTSDRIFVVCHLTVDGVTRSDGGECRLDDRNALTSAIAQAFKRACAKFGLGRYLYFLPNTWAEYDSRKKGFTKSGKRELRAALKRVLKRANRDR